MIKFHSVSNRPVVHLSIRRDAFFIAINSSGGVHGNQFYFWHRRVGGFRVRNINADHAVRVRQAGLQNMINGVARNGGGAWQICFAAITNVQADGNGGHAQERGLHGGGDGAGINHVYAHICAKIHAAHHHIGLRICAIFFLPQGAQAKLHAIGWRSHHRSSVGAVKQRAVARHQWRVESNAVAFRALTTGGRHHHDFTQRLDGRV